MSLALFTLLLTPTADAFCGTYVGSSGDLYNSASRVALSRFGDLTTITMANDVQGDTSDFAIVVPVPEIPGPDDVNVIDPEVFERLDGYSEPRLVSYECEDFFNDYDYDSAGGGEEDTGGAGDVDVEARYIVGEYEVVILSATESGALVEWLQASGYAVADASAELLQEYIDGGSYFFAAKVGPDAEIESGDTLSPLQFSYEAETWALPVRLGTLNSQGEQDLVVYTANAYEDGEAGIANYTEAVIEDGCLWEPEADEPFTEFYANRLSSAHSAPGANWVVEYSWGQMHCDPCTGVTPDASDMVALGVSQENVEDGDLWFTRLHLRYAPDDVNAPLALYHSDITTSRQQRYIQHEGWLQEFFEVCDQGWLEPEDACEDSEYYQDGDDNELDWDSEDDAKGCGGCATTGATPAAGLLLMGLLGLARRRQA